MSQSLDLRITKTDKLIKEAFLDLIDEIGFEKITIINLTKRAMISRTTFYAHYKDKYDLLEQMEDEVLEGIKNITKDFSFDEVFKSEFQNDNFFNIVINIYEYINENKRIFEMLLCNNVDPYFYLKLHETFKNIYKNINTDFLEIPENYATAFIVGVHTSIISEWIRSGMKESPKELISMFISSFSGIFKNLII